MDSFEKAVNKPLPKFLYRYFERESYALDFLSGNVRLGLYLAYREQHGNIRENNYEGTFKVNFNRKTETTKANGGGVWPLYCLCAFSPEARPRVMEAHGKYKVIIKNPALFHSKIQDHLVGLLQFSRVGTMVYEHENINPTGMGSILSLSIFSDMPNNIEKSEIRYTYYFNPIKIAAKELMNAESIISGSKELINAGGLQLPKYITLNRLSISGLCEMLNT